MKVAINRCFGGFDLSTEAIIAIAARKGITVTQDPTDSYYPTYTTSSNEPFYPSTLYEDRADSDLIAVIEELGSAASGRYGKLVIVNIPDDIKWYISEYDGMETVEEVHRSWS